MSVLTVCNSAYRSSMGAAVLLKMGFKNVFNMEGGSEAWIQAGLPTLGATSATQGPAASAVRAIRLPERLSSAELKRMMMDIPGTFEVIDIRPPAQFADFNLPGSVNVDIAVAISSPAYLVGTAPLVIVDRDGSLAMAVGGILSQKTQRTVKVLYGGLDLYWSESVSPAPRSMPAAAPVMTPSAPAPIRNLEQAPKPAAPATPKRKSAGC